MKNAVETPTAMSPSTHLLLRTEPDKLINTGVYMGIKKSSHIFAYFGTVFSIVSSGAMVSNAYADAAATLLSQPFQAGVNHVD